MSASLNCVLHAVGPGKPLSAALASQADKIPDALVGNQVRCESPCHAVELLLTPRQSPPGSIEVQPKRHGLGSLLGCGDRFGEQAPHVQGRVTKLIHKNVLAARWRIF